MGTRGLVRASALFLVAASAALAAPQTPTTTQSAVGAKVWIGRARDFEAFILTAPIVRMEAVPVGITNPRRAYLAPGGLAESIACKMIKPGLYGRFWESYRYEIAAYEVDKLLQLDMVPPTVERRIKSDLGAAVLWVQPVKSFGELGGPPTPPTDKVPMWNRQVVRAQMFDNLIHNIDPNLGNWLVDPDWNLILIDHTRAFAGGKDMVHKMNRIDRELWQRIQALTEDQLTTALSRWLNKGEIRDIPKRRQNMQELIDQKIAEKGAEAVYLP